MTQVTLECWGGGGRGGTRSSNGRGGGGGGGAYARSVLSVTPGNSYTVTVGAGSTSASPGGDSWFGSTTTVMAKGGNSVANNSSTGATGGSAAASFGDVVFDGGDGANAPGGTGGGGGSSAGTAANGNNASGGTGASAPSGGGDGGNGGNGTFGTGANGSAPGGGGGGAERGCCITVNAGNGGAGRVVVTYTYNPGSCMSATGANAIADNGCASGNSLNVGFPISGLPTVLGAAPGQARLISVELIVSHTWNNDLDITLTSPTGQTRNLLLDRFSSGDNLGDPSNCPDATLVLMDGATALPAAATIVNNATGPYAPEQTLAGFAGDPNGTWTLTICDDAADDLGNFLLGKLNFCSVPQITGTTSNSPVCSTDDLVLSVTATGNPAVAYSWSGTGTFSPNNTSANVTVDGPATGNYTITVSNTCGSDNATVPVTVTSATTWYADADSDGSGDPGVTQQACSAPPGYVSNNNDGCPSDPNKIAPGICGCGTADVDSDGDSVFDCFDGCPSDPNKFAPGICGCGVADTDTDSDGTADCNDGCPNDPLKTAPGQCGCGNPETGDTDGDGTADCVDGCPTDPNKIAPGQCGCGVSDADLDNDGTPDCNDGCPNDANKTAPGQCGCGVPESADTDGDGTLDCVDACPTDPNKIAPGQCGCGAPDTDTDSDGTADCNDNCPNDPNKINPGICGCGSPDVDTDGDTVFDCFDGCPNDPDKFAPGQCGCGTPDTDTDSDGTANCNDGCPNDPNKIAPGDCGCGNVETGDTDEDGVADCLDGCPFDDTKTAPGNCGCGNPEPGAACDDGDNTTGEDTVQPDCSCAGVPVDCNYVPSGPDMPGTACDDGNAATGNDTWGADCLCVGELLDCEGTPGGTALPGSVCDDGLATTGNDMYGADCVCAGEPIDCEGTPNGTALPGTPCDDGDPNTINDLWDGSCACVGTPSCIGNMVTLTLNTDANGNQTSWEIVPVGGGAALCQGSGFASNSSIDSDCCLADGCYRLLVYDSFGDGMTTGGYVLRDANGEMIIDNAGNGGFTSMSAIANNGGFCLPMGVDHLIAADCGRMDLLPSSTIKSTVSGAVSAQYGVGDQTDDGYQFWLFDPNGSYSRVIFKSHANHTPGTPQGPGACSNLVLSSLQTMPPPANKMLNVRVRTRVNGVNSEYGPACRIMIDLVGTCPTTTLVNAPNDPKHSCGASKTVSASSKLYANAVAGANKFQWRFENTANSYVRTIATTGEVVTIGNWATNPLLCGTHVYQVSLRASFDGGATYCPYGAVCNVTITNNNSNCTQNFQGGGANLHVVQQEESGMAVWPNPMRDGRLTVKLHGLNEAEAVTTIELYDMFGKRVHAQSLATDGATELTTVLELPQLATGLYILNATSGERLFTSRVAVQ
ncbi:MAG: T9SS type A sorting domain-containing protein [Flavobacteriales bacterium]|nr:MAG: T9SS type A sorting domain-containing protein [Flavobacteriales bacterium]